jgi:peptide/nickel transport system permease protein
MPRWLALRLLWILPTLLGITFVTFAMLDLAPVDRAEIEAEQATIAGSYADTAARDAAIVRLRVHYGMVDPVTGEPRPLWRRYGAWLGNAVTLRFAGPGDDDAALWRRLSEAAPVTMLLGALGLSLAFGVGLPLGTWLGRRRGSRRETAVSTLLLIGGGVPEFLLATLLLLAFSVAWLQWFPSSGLRSHGAEHWTFVWQVADFAHHLVLPVAVISLAPIVLVSRFVRDAVARAEAAPFVASMHALGLEQEVVRRRLWRHGAVPVATLVGSLMPMLVGGSIIVENLFALDGFGHLAYRAVFDQDQAMVMALVLLTSVVTLVALVLSDVTHRLVDARVRLRP